MDRDAKGLDWGMFFPPGTRVLALPSWRRPRLYLTSRNASQRWEHSSFYPASRLPARLHRLALRFKISAGMAQARTVCSSDWPLGEFVRDALPETTSAVALLGTIGPTQETTVQLRDDGDRVLGYLKYAEKEAARRRLKHERFMLSNIPDGIGPLPVKAGTLVGGEALLKSVVPGSPVPATLPPPQGLLRLLESLVVSPPISLDDHPWVHRARRDEVAVIDTALKILEGKRWPVVVQHGDLTPWNMLKGADGKLRAVDWEYGALEGFPLFDLIHYIFHTSALIYRWAPLKSARYAAKYLVERYDPALSGAEAWALVRLTAYDDYSKALEDGQPPDAGMQPWRRQIWKSVA